jgi:hypothetical protein
VICNTDKYGFAWIDVVLGPTTGSDDVIVSASNALSNYIQIDIRQPPAIGAGGVVMNGSFTAPVAPGSYVSIFGTGLTDYTDTATTATLPLSLDNVTVSVDVPSAGISVPARMVHVTQLNGYDQLDIQMPWRCAYPRSAGARPPGRVVEGGVVGDDHHAIGVAAAFGQRFQFSPLQAKRGTCGSL